MMKAGVGEEGGGKMEGGETKREEREACVQSRR